MAVFFGHPEYWQAWGDLHHSIQTGEYAFRHVHGMSPWEYRVHHPEAGAVFDRAMIGLSRAGDNAALAAYDFGHFGSVVDVGGGQGAFLAALLARYQGARGIPFDRARRRPGAACAGGGWGGRPLPDRGGKLFESIPEGGDAYVMKHVLVDWEDEDALAVSGRAGA